MRILVTDDEPLQLNGMVSILRRILPDAEISHTSGRMTRWRRRMNAAST